MKRLVLSSGVVCLVLCVSIQGEVLPAAGAGDPRIRVAVYSPDEVYRLYAEVGYDLRLEFSKDEQFLSVDGGDLDAITYSAHDHVFSFKPRAAHADTNLTVTTSRRTYYFRYSTGVQIDHENQATVMYVVRFQYSPEVDTQSIADRHAAQIQKDLSKASQGRTDNTDYWYCGPPSLRPVAASDDGVHTRLSFAVSAELPALFLQNPDGSESLLNFTVEGGDLVVHRVAPRFVVRRGGLVGCIVNKGFEGGGNRLETGTVSPDVTRDTKAPEQ